jgi:hypothetical protein
MEVNVVAAIKDNMYFFNPFFIAQLSTLTPTSILALVLVRMFTRLTRISHFLLIAQKNEG